MIIIRVKFNLKPDKRAEGIQYFLQMAKESEAENGCFGYEFSASLEDPNTIFLLEQWKDAGVLASHGQAEHFLRFQKEMAGVLAGRPVIKRYEVTTEGPLTF